MMLIIQGQCCSLTTVNCLGFMAFRLIQLVSLEVLDIVFLVYDFIMAPWLSCVLVSLD